MPRKSVKSEASTASPDPATPARAAKSTPAKSAASKKDRDTPAKTASARSTPSAGSGGRGPKTPKTPKDKDATATPASKQRRQSKPRMSAADKQIQRGNGSSSSSHTRKAPLAHLPPAVKLAAVEAVTLALLLGGRLALAAATRDEMGALLRAAAGPLSVRELAVLGAWRGAEVALAWAANLDLVDVGLASFVAHAPVFWLAAQFYSVRPATALGAALVDAAAPAAAFALARPLSGLRSGDDRRHLYNRDLVSAPFQLLAGALAAAVYAAVVSLALRFVLPRVLVLGFRGIPTVAPAYAASFVALLPTAALFGLAASKFLFAPYVTTGRSKEDDKIRQFDPVRATLRETVWWNVWGYTLRSRIVITRTAILTVMTAVSTYLACFITIDGVTCFGAATYALVWASATAGTGLALGLVGQE